MKFWEAMKLVREGKKVRAKGWIKGDFIYFNCSKREIVDEDGKSYFDGEHDDLNDYYRQEWEEYFPVYNFNEAKKAAAEGREIRKKGNSAWWSKEEIITLGLKEIGNITLLFDEEWEIKE